MLGPIGGDAGDSDVMGAGRPAGSGLDPPRPTGPLAAYARFVVKARWFLIIGWILATVAAVLLLPDVKSAHTGSVGDLVANDADAIDAEERSVDLFRFPVLSRTVIVQRREGGFTPAAAARIYSRATAIGLGNLPGLEAIPFALPVTNDVAKGISIAAVPPTRPTAALTYLFFPTDIGPVGRTGLAERLVTRYISRPSDGEVGVTGAVPARAEQVRKITDSLPLVELATILLVTLAVGVHYRSVGAPLANVVTVAVTYLASVHLIGGAGQLIGISVPEEVEPVMVALLFGIVTDYSIFFISRFRQYVLEGVPSLLAAERTTWDLTPTIFAAGISVAAACSTLVFAQLGFFQAFGPGMALAVLVAIAVVCTFVPAVLAVSGERILWPSRRRREAADPSAASPPLQRIRDLRAALLAIPSRRPVLVATASALPLVALAIAVTGLELGNSVISGLPAGSPPRQALAEARKGFVPGAISPTMIMLEGDSISERRPQLRRVQRLLAARDNVAEVVGPSQLRGDSLDLGAVISPTGDAVRYLVVFDVNPLGSRGIAALSGIRRNFDELLAKAGVGDAKFSLAGDTAISEETVTKTRDDLARILPLAALAVFLILAIFLRALVAPLYLVVASLLALAASLGLTVLVFQDLLGFGELTFYVPFSGIVLLIALGSDYNVYLVGRVWAEAREQPIRRAVAVAAARASTAITVAGVVLSISFALLAIVPLQPFRELAFLLASGLLIDAFIVRSMLAPALITIFGESSGWPGTRLRRKAGS